MKQPEKNAQDAFARHSQQPNPATRVSHCFPTLLDPWNVPGREPLLAQHPSASTANIIWIQYLRNVHPLVKIFFDWEVEPLMRKGAKEPNTLTQGEQSVVFAIYFVAILSISEEECATVLYDRKPQLLERFQRAAEDALISSQFITTTDIRVLQAFMLYLVSI